MVKNTSASIKAGSDLDKTMGFGERSRMMKRWGGNWGINDEVLALVVLLTKSSF